MADCDPEPSVNNGRATVTSGNDTWTASYECLTGFYMSGTARITCNTTEGTWEAPPTCSVITQSNTFYNSVSIPDSTEEWWYYLLFGLLGLVALILLSALLWCCCCCHASPVHPYIEHAQGRGCCHRRRCCSCCCQRRERVRLDTAERLQGSGATGSIYWIDSPSRGGKPRSTCPVSTPAYSQCNGDLPQTGGTHSQNIAHSQSGRIGLGNATRSRNWEINNKNTPRDNAMTSVETPAKDPYQYKPPRPAKDPTKDTKIWMPHSHTIRKINTSTK